MEEKMSEEEWHKLAAKALAKENEKLIQRLLDEMKATTDLDYQRRQEGLRDQFAGMAMQGMFSNPNIKNVNAHSCYVIADKMLKEREDKNEK